MTKNLLNLIALIICNGALTAQIIKGKVLDTKTKEPIAFANIGILGKGIGTVTNEDGTFELNISKSSAEDIIRFSYIGYNSLSFTNSQYQKQFNDIAVVYLTESNYNLNEVVIRPKVFKSKVVGNTGKGIENASFVDNSLDTSNIGFEVGTRIKIKERPTYIDEVVINFSKNESKGCIFRLNIYDGKIKNTPNILKEPIYITIDKELSTLKIDLKKYNILVENDFIIALECVKRTSKMKVNMYAVMGGSDICIRSSINDEWGFVSLLGFSMSATVTYEDKGFFANLFD